ncbi:hypothetical protein Cni_G28759 [Canna indica]|uniref:Reverse transcriptase n=1 Tax=Canna indica TaxID=4628 RepID=A0AAQ3L622_9LILI|nr:hypothetical protein Cni_G28759 [Canna indica]
MSSSHIIEVGKNLKSLSGKLTSWAKSNIGHLEKSLNEANEELTRLDQIDEEGKCTKYKKCKSTINNVYQEGVQISDPLEVSNAFADWYKKLWKDDAIVLDCPEWGIVENLKWKKLKSREKVQVMNSFSAEEVWRAVNSLGRGKAPGPNGYNIEFFIRYWDILGNSIHLAIKEFSQTTVLPVSWGDTRLVFIPKKEGPTNITDYRPISLCKCHL